MEDLDQEREFDSPWKHMFFRFSGPGPRERRIRRWKRLFTGHETGSLFKRRLVEGGNIGCIEGHSRFHKTGVGSRHKHDHTPEVVIPC